MLEAIAIVLVLLWLLGMVFSCTLGGTLHVLLLLAFIVMLMRFILGRNPLQ